MKHVHTIPKPELSEVEPLFFSRRMSFAYSAQLYNLKTVIFFEHCHFLVAFGYRIRGQGESRFYDFPVADPMGCIAS